LANDLQGIENLVTNLVTMLIVGVEAKTRKMTISHVRAYPENTP
jgi:hypothetical protein